MWEVKLNLLFIASFNLSQSVNTLDLCSFYNCLENLVILCSRNFNTPCPSSYFSLSLLERIFLRHKYGHETPLLKILPLFFIHSPNIYRAHTVCHTLHWVGAGTSAVNKTLQNPALVELTFQWGRETIHKQVSI